MQRSLKIQKKSKQNSKSKLTKSKRFISTQIPKQRTHTLHHQSQSLSSLSTTSQYSFNNSNHHQQQQKHTPFKLLTTKNQSRSMSSQPQTTPQIFNKAVVLKPKGEHKNTVIFLHGLGDEGASFVDVFQMLNLKHTKVILPNAPQIPVTCNGGWVMPGWYDIASLGDDRTFGQNEDVDGINITIEKLVQGIEYEASLLTDTPDPYSKIVIGGFSQGSAVTQATAARLKHKLAGVVALSGYALLTEQDEKVNPINTTNTPYFIYHGKADEIVKIDYARKSKQYWENKKALDTVEYTEESNLGHSLSQREIVAVAGFLQKVLPGAF